MAYEPNPSYRPVGGQIAWGWEEAVAELPDEWSVLSVDGPAVLDWDAVLQRLRASFAAAGRGISTIDLRGWLLPWNEIVRRTEATETSDDPDFAKLPSVELRSLFSALPRPAREARHVVAGPGAALVEHDIAWYADLPKRHATDWITRGLAHNLGQSGGLTPSLRRLQFVDWPIQDRHLQGLLETLNRYVDLQDLERPRSIAGTALRATLADLARRPFRTLPTFNTTPWGGHWAQRELRMSLDAPNTAIGYELIAPEASVLLADGPGRALEVPFHLVVSHSPRELLGQLVAERFAGSFPIRFDYLDTYEGGHLSVHVHPRSGYMRRVFGWQYTQHETYYVMVGGERGQIFLGLRDDADVAAFHRDAEAADQSARPFEIERYVQFHRATPHQLFAIPAGTPHGSSAGNVVLEISATPYLYSLRLYDWLRRDGNGGGRPVHVGHAFRNLDTRRIGHAVADQLIREPRVTSVDHGWRIENLTRHRDLFFAVDRVVVESGGEALLHTGGRFRVLNVAAGDGILVQADRGEHALNYAETLVVPAAVGPYSLRSVGGPAFVVEAHVRA